MIADGGNRRKVVFSGDLGQYDTPILRDPTPVAEADYQQWVAGQGKARHIVTLLTRKVTAEQLQRVSSITAKYGLNIDHIDRLSGRMPLDMPEDFCPQVINRLLADPLRHVSAGEGEDTFTDESRKQEHDDEGEALHVSRDNVIVDGALDERRPERAEI